MSLPLPYGLLLGRVWGILGAPRRTPRCAPAYYHSGDAVSMRESVLYECGKLSVDVWPLKQSLNTSKSPQIITKLQRHQKLSVTAGRSVTPRSKGMPPN